MLLTERGFKKEHRGIELSNGSKMWWVTTEQGWMSMRGAEQDIEAVDEECGWDEFNQVKRGLRNAKGGGRIYGALTPPYKEGQGPTWTKEKVVDAALEDPNICVINACMADNPAISKEYIEWWTKGKTQKQIDVEVYGKYPAWGDLVHPDFQDRIWDAEKVDGHLLRNDTPLPDRNDVDWVMAFDWHQSKPCAAVFGFITRDGSITFFDELDRDLATGKQINELADLFRQIEDENTQRRKFRRWQDPSAKHNYNAVERGFNAWDAFRKAGIVTSVGKNRDTEVGISIVNQYFRGNGKDHPRIFIYERCKYTRQYLVNHYWKRGEDGKGKPDPKWSDYPVCIKYLCQEYGQSAGRERRSKWPLTSFGDQKSKPRVIDISRWG
uniref:Terminase n=1 Tax=viral metagenome TaxID=1070528 RepID=A0A6M3XB43_9ZZZZ